MGSQLLPSLKNQHRFRAETDNQQACSETAGVLNVCCSVS